MIYIVKNEKETRLVAKDFAKNIKPGNVVFLTGDLGAGKTKFCSFLFGYLGVKNNITSPTFVINKNYIGKIKNEQVEINHYDLYRIKTQEELYDLEIADRLDGGNVAFIEWPQVAESVLKNFRGYKIKISKIGETEREIEIDER